MSVSVRLRFVLLLIGMVFGVLVPGSAQAGDELRPQNYRIQVHPRGMPPLQLYAEEMGRGPTVLLLHGLGGSSYTWRMVAPALARRNRVIAIDLRGFGRSDKPFDQAYSPHHHAAVVRAFMNARRLSGVTLVGHSFGGLVALMLASDRGLPGRKISRLVIIDAPAYPQPLSPAVRFLRMPVLPYLTLSVVPPELPTTLAFMMEKVGFDRLTTKDIQIYADPLLAPGGPHGLIATARNIVPRNIQALVAGYRRIAKPTLVIWCRDDQVVPLSSGTRLAREIPKARLAVLDGCDHVPPEQAPRAVVSHLSRFLAHRR